MSRLVPIPCPVCGKEFAPPRKETRTCSRSCGSKLGFSHPRKPRPPLTDEQRAVVAASAKARVWPDGHPRGMAGKNHSPETRAIISQRGRERFARMTEEERKAYGEAVKKSQGERKWTPRQNRFSNARSGRRPDLGGYYFRSMWEANYARYLQWMQEKGDIRSWEYEVRTFDFPERGRNGNYTPDFLVVDSAGVAAWHEVKGWMDDDSRIRLERFAKHYPDECMVIVGPDQYWEISDLVAGLIPAWETKKTAFLKAPSIPCAVSSCDEDAVARGWCGRHWQRWQATGDPETPDRRFKKNRQAS